MAMGVFGSLWIVRSKACWLNGVDEPKDARMIEPLRGCGLVNS